MKIRDLVFILIGLLMGLVIFEVYGAIRYPASPGAQDLNALNKEISRGRENAIVHAASEVSTSVVSITVTQTRIVSATPFLSPFDDDFFRDFFPEFYYKQKVKSLGTGIIVANNGYILTNEHVISNATEINVTLSDGRQFNGTISAKDRTVDLALIKIDTGELPCVQLGDSDSLLIGEWTIALGNPFGFLLEDAQPTVTVGVISALNRAIKSTQDDRVYKDMIQTDAAINPGNSGGPLVNILGQVIGINTFIFTSGGGSEGIGFARPINDAKAFIAEAMKTGN